MDSLSCKGRSVIWLQVTAFSLGTFHVRVLTGRRLLGSKPELGAWDPAGSPLVLEWHEGHQWTAECELPAG